MMVFIVEAGGRRIAAINAGSIQEAEEHTKSLGFKITVMSLQRNGSPLWDGEAKFVIREGSIEENKKWATTSDTELVCTVPIE
jgi:hypothetical protein